MFVSYKILFYSLTTIISHSWSSAVKGYWKTFPYTGPVTFNYYSLIPNSSAIHCAATCRRLYNWDQMYFQGKDCYCLAPVYEANLVSRNVTTNRGFWTTYHDVTSCSEKGYTPFLDEEYCLKYFTTKETWYDAELTCQQDGGHLVSVYNRQDLANLKSVGRNEDYILIGAHRTVDGTEFFWITGGNVNMSFWRSGQPDNINGNDNCLEVINSQLFNDIPCHYIRNFMCKILI